MNIPTLRGGSLVKKTVGNQVSKKDNVLLTTVELQCWRMYRPRQSMELSLLASRMFEDCGSPVVEPLDLWADLPRRGTKKHL